MTEAHLTSDRLSIKVNGALLLAILVLLDLDLLPLLLVVEAYVDVQGRGEAEEAGHHKEGLLGEEEKGRESERATSGGGDGWALRGGKRGRRLLEYCRDSEVLSFRRKTR